MIFFFSCFIRGSVFRDFEGFVSFSVVDALQYGWESFMAFRLAIPDKSAQEQKWHNFMEAQWHMVLSFCWSHATQVLSKWEADELEATIQFYLYSHKMTYGHNLSKRLFTRLFLLLSLNFYDALITFFRDISSNVSLPPWCGSTDDVIPVSLDSILVVLKAVKSRLRLV